MRYNLLSVAKLLISKVANRKPIGITGVYEYAVNQDAVSVAANTTSAESFAVPGVKAGDHVVSVNPPALPAGLALGQAYVTADDTIVVPLTNTTAGALDPAIGDWTFLVTATEAM